MSRVLPSLRLSYSELTKIIEGPLRALDSPARSNLAIADIFSCVYKVRFQSGDPGIALYALSTELSLRFLLHWTAAIQRAVALSGVTHDCVSRMVLNLANTIAVLADTLDIDTQQLVAASVFFYDERAGAGVAHEGENIATAIQVKLSICHDGQRGYLTDRSGGP
jgi:hypothetical protein